jgi:FkbM family methyltransferase
MKSIKAKLNFASWLVIESVKLDFYLIKRGKGILLESSFRFIFKKYVLLMKHLFAPYKPGNKVSIDGNLLCYDSKYGVAGFQRILTTHGHLIRSLEVQNVNLVVDVGANVGYFSLMCRKMFPSCSVLAFEPVPEIFDLLRSNLGGLGNSQLFQIALGRHEGTEKMKVNQFNRAESKVDLDGDLEVLVSRLDLFETQMQDLGVNGRVDILKIDVETFELEVLQGAIKTLEKTRYLFLEVTFLENTKYTISSLLGKLSSPKFDFQLIGYRNFSGSSEGPTVAFEMFFKNTRYSE